MAVPVRTPTPSLLSISLSCAVSLAGLSLAAPAQKLPPGPTPIQPAPADPAIAAALAKISPGQIRADIAKLVSFNNRSTISSMETDLPPGTGVSAAADWLESEYKRISASCNGCLEVKRDDFIEPPQTTAKPRILKPTKLTNIYAVLKGTDPAQSARRVLVTGHYDSRVTDPLNDHDPAPGANDDASGVAVSLECARVLSSSGIRFPSTLVFVAVAGEEQGLNGSAHLAKLAKAEGWQLEAVLNNDIVGGDTTPGAATQDKSAVRVFSEGVPGPATLPQLSAIQTIGAESDSPSRELARAVVEIASSYFKDGQQRPPAVPGRPRSMLVQMVPAFHPVLIFRRDRYRRGGDHTSFNLQGFPAIRFTEWRENFDHQHQDLRVAPGKLPDGSTGQVQYGDLIQFVDMDYVANVARLNAATLATLALAPGMPQNAAMATENLDNDTTISWHAPAGMPAGASYEIVWRDSAAPTWTSVQNVGSVLTVTLPISKDNVVFGVRSVDAAGHRSIAAYPVPPPAPPVPGVRPAGQ